VKFELFTNIIYYHNLCNLKTWRRRIFSR